MPLLATLSTMTTRSYSTTLQLLIEIIMIRNIVRGQLFRCGSRGVYGSWVKQPLWIAKGIEKTSGRVSPVVMRPLYAFCSNQKKPQDDPEKKKQKEGEDRKEEKEAKEEEKGEEKQLSWRQQLDKFLDNFWQKPDPAEPSRKIPSKPQQLMMKLATLVEVVMQKMRILYSQKFSLSSILSLLLCLYLSIRYLTHQKQITPSSFMELLKMNSFKEVQFIEEEYFRSKEATYKKITGKINSSEVYYCEVMSFDDMLTFVMNDGHIKYQNVRRSSVESAFQRVYNVADIMLMVLILGSIIRAPKGGMGGGGMGQNGPKQKKFDVIKNMPIKFNDVAGLEESKREVQEVVDFLKYPGKYTALGAVIPKGILLTGPPGTGKTLLAKSTAGEAGVPFFSVSGSDFVEVFVGVGASRVRQLFQQANEQAPSIIFIDELDAVGKKRQNKMGSNDERESTLNQLLVQMDGFGTSSNVIVMAATNRKDVLDDALVRPGRFDREVEVGLPDLKGRFEILLVHLRPVILSPKYTTEEYAKRIASLTPGFSGAELANLCNEAAILAARCQKEYVEMLDFELSSERVIGGVERKGFVNVKEKKTVAYHQSGHAVVSWFLEGADPLLKVTIIPRSKGALGFAQYFINENQLQTKEDLLDRICFILGGRCAQLYFFNEITTGAYDDLQKAYNLAYSMVTKLGMNTELGYIAFPESEYTKPYGQLTEAIIDRQIKKIIHQCTQKTKEMIKLHAEDIRNLAEELLVKETMDVRSIRRILGDRPFPVNKTFEAYLETEGTQ